MIVAINKIDKEGAQPDRVKRADGLTPEEWGGNYGARSAIKGKT